MKAKITRLDHQGQGIALVEGIVTFIPKTVPGDVVNIVLKAKKKTYQTGELVNLITPSPSRKPAFCPYYALCGGCQLQNLSYEDTLDYKLKRLEDILTRQKIKVPIELISNPQPQNYRNKITLKVIAGEIGFYEFKTKKLIPINNCALAQTSLNELISHLKLLKIKAGEITLRTNSEGDILVNVESTDNIDYQTFLKNVTIKGLIINKEKVYGQDYLIQKINDLAYKVSYDAFFQVNPLVSAKLFSFITGLIKPDSRVLDLYCGVGTLSLSAALKAKNVFGIEIVPNAIIDARENAQINNLTNAHFEVGNVEERVANLKDNFDTWIIDPPRQGILPKTKQIISEKLPSMIIYVSCDALTFARDLAFFQENYTIEKVYCLDMFSYTYHSEQLAILKRKKYNKIK